MQYEKQYWDRKDFDRIKKTKKLWDYFNITPHELTVPSVFTCHVTTSHDFLFCIDWQLPCIQFQSYSIMHTQPQKKKKNLKFPFFTFLSLHTEESFSMATCFCLCLRIFITFWCCTVCGTDISCRNEAGEPVDWWVVMMNCQMIRIRSFNGTTQYRPLFLVLNGKTVHCLCHV